ncbi:MAG TPA: HAMP domain-containing sensor histidine kinase [Ilumatobacteraceae bacterium]|nr:HAMP domain-containing sensor histidine kinase [Ilumatobacteraceae bacterium]
MSLRVRIILALAVLASVATGMIGVATYQSTRNELLRTIDHSLDDAVRQMPAGWNASGDSDDGPPIPRVGRGRLREAVFVQFVSADGTINSRSSVELPVNKTELALAAAAQSGRSRRDVDIDGEEFRMLTVSAPNGAVQVARSLAETKTSLGTIARRTLFAVTVVVAAAILIGWWIGRHITRRLFRLNAAARAVASTGDLDVPIPVSGNDEVAELGHSISGMLGALGASRAAQHQLVQDAGHELRTPLTSLRTNVSVLRRYDTLKPEDRQQILSDLDSETRELTELVNELVELATDRRDVEEPQVIDLGATAERVVQRARRRSGREITVSVDDSRVLARDHAIERAIHNLVDNAVKFSPGGPIEVTVQAGTVTVRDHGAGIGAEDQVKVFDRFYRAVDVRSLPGSGLGLSIVRAAAEADGGTVFARNAVGGGAELGFTLPLTVTNQ